MGVGRGHRKTLYHLAPSEVRAMGDGMLCLDADGVEILPGDIVRIIGGDYAGKNAKVTGFLGGDLLIWPEGGYPTWAQSSNVRFLSRPERDRLPDFMTQER